MNNNQNNPLKKGRKSVHMKFDNYRDIPLQKLKVGESIKVGKNTGLEASYTIAYGLKKATKTMRKKFSIVSTKSNISVIRIK